MLVFLYRIAGFAFLWIAMNGQRYDPDAQAWVKMTFSEVLIVLLMCSAANIQADVEIIKKEARAKRDEKP